MIHLAPHRTLPPSLVALHFLLAAPLLAQEPAPSDEAPPEPERRLHVRTPGAYEGYTLLSPINSKRIVLLDMAGELVHEWQTEHAPAGAFHFMPDGTILRCARKEENPRFHGGGIGGLVQKIGWDGKILWQFELADDSRTQHHDFEILPNGNLLLIAWEYLPPEEAIALGRDPAAVGGDGLWPDSLIEIRPTGESGGEIVWEWHAWDHLVQDFDPSKPGYDSVAEHPERIDINADHRAEPPLTEEERRRRRETEAQMRELGYVGGEDEEKEEEAAAAPAEDEKQDPDWLHTNAVRHLPAHDLVVLSTPELCELWVIDHSTTTEEAAGHSGGRWGRGGDLLWRWGNPRNYGAGTDADRRLDYQHDPTWITGTSAADLRLLVFDNGMRRETKDSRVEELLLPFDPRRGFAREAGAPFGPKEPVWSYADPEKFYSAFISGAQRLPNGNTLICAGAPGRVFEVTAAGEIVWDYWNPHGGDIEPSGQGGRAPPHALFRATRIAPDHPGIAGRL